MTAKYVSYLLGYMDEVRRLHRADSAVYSLECWDRNSSYFQFNDRLQELRDADGNIAYQGGLGPFYFDVGEFDRALSQIV